MIKKIVEPVPHHVCTYEYKHLWCPEVCLMLGQGSWTKTNNKMKLKIKDVPLCPNPHRTSTSNLALLIAQMQKNADQVEKDVLRAEELLAVVRKNKQ